LKDLHIEWISDTGHVEERILKYLKNIIKHGEKELTIVFEDMVRCVSWWADSGGWWEAVQIFRDSLECPTDIYAKTILKVLVKGYTNHYLEDFIPQCKYESKIAEQHFISSGILAVANIDLQRDVAVAVALGRPMIIAAILDHCDVKFYKCVFDDDQIDSHSTDVKTIMRALASDRISVTLSPGEMDDIIERSGDSVTQDEIEMMKSKLTICERE
jgi:hypothetical protein